MQTLSEHEVICDLCVAPGPEGPESTSSVRFPCLNVLISGESAQYFLHYTCGQKPNLIKQKQGKEAWIHKSVIKAKQSNKDSNITSDVI